MFKCSEPFNFLKFTCFQVLNIIKWSSISISYDHAYNHGNNHGDNMTMPVTMVARAAAGVLKPWSGPPHDPLN